MMSHHWHIEWVWHRQFDGIHAFYVNALLRSLVFSMIGIFTPVYLYQVILGVSGEITTAIAGVGLFYLVVRLINFLIAIPVARVIERLGFRRSVLVSVVALSVYLPMMIMAGDNYLFLLPAAFFLALENPLYWISRGSVVAIDTNRSEVGKQVGILFAAERVAGVAGPVAAGLIVTKWGFPYMYAAAFAVLCVSVLPLLNMPHHVHRNGVSLKGFGEWIKSRSFFHQAVSAVAEAQDGFAYGLVWPLVLLLMGISYEGLGLYFAGLTVITIVVRWSSGVWFDKLYKRGGWEDESLFVVSSVGLSLSHVGRVVVAGLRTAFLLDLVATIFGTANRSISSSYLTLGGKRMHEIAYYTYREMAFSIGAIALCLFWIAGAKLGVGRELVFLSGALWSLLGVVQAKESSMR